MEGAAPIRFPSDVAIGMTVGPIDHFGAGQICDLFRGAVLPAFGVMAFGRAKVVRAKPSGRFFSANALRARCRNLIGSIFFRGLGTFLLLRDVL